MGSARDWMMAAGVLSVIASLLHLGCIVGGPDWYRALGAGERMARMAALDRPGPAIITALIAGVIAVWAVYAFAAAGLIRQLPLMRLALVLISAVLLVRGLAGPLMQRWRPDLSTSFIYGSSAIVLAYGMTFAVGTWLVWPTLSMKDEF
ncbi:MAG: hypothetical protein B7Y43_09715 [Sphingomonas sp. 28-62-20]|uniref:hypothetical protein n=1 Tax=Sphingomonas sp. 28-62-20 TaxID=1970433 RepID=UPI000BCF9ED0|nr:MAG: hypothetical protein B7Y43_09715 [Sphingomonas sp. 28-62-20]